MRSAACPLHDNRGLFEFLIVGGAQAASCWGAIFKKRDADSRSFDNFDPVDVAV